MKTKHPKDRAYGHTTAMSDETVLLRQVIGTMFVAGDLHCRVKFFNRLDDSKKAQVLSRLRDVLEAVRDEIDLLLT